MSRFNRVCLASTMFATVLMSAAFAQPPERERGDRGRGGDAGGERRGFGGPGGPPEGRRGGPPPEMMMRMMPVLAALDADHDGKISKAEIDNATAALKTLDKNDDGQLTEEELRPDFAGRGGPGGGPPGDRGPEGRGRGGPEGRGRGGPEGRGPGGPEGRGPGGPEGRGPGGPGGPEGRGPGGNLSDMVDRLMQLDENKDGKLSKDEVPGRAKSLVERADANEDGVTTREELQAMVSRGRGPGGPGGAEFFLRMFEERDANKDGKLSGDEIPEQMAGRIERIDTDKDGSVSREEVRTMMSRMQGEGRGAPEGSGRPGGDRPRRPEAE